MICVCFAEPSSLGVAEPFLAWPTAFLLKVSENGPEKGQTFSFLDMGKLTAVQIYTCTVYKKKYPSTGIPCILTMKRKNSLPWSRYSTVFLAKKKSFVHKINYLYILTSPLESKVHTNSKTGPKKSHTIIEGHKFLGFKLRGWNGCTRL